MKLILGFLLFSNALWAQVPLQESFDQIKDDVDVLWSVSMGEQDVSVLTNYQLDHLDLSLGRLKERRELAALIVIQQGQLQLRNVSMGSDSATSVSYQLKAGDEWVGDVHTHPYKYASLSDLPFSPRDVVTLIQTKDLRKAGYFKLIRAGQKYFALKIVDPTKVERFLSEQEELAKKQNQTLFDYTYKKFYSINHGQSIQEIQLNSLKKIVGNAEETGVQLLESSGGTFRLLN